MVTLLFIELALGLVLLLFGAELIVRGGAQFALVMRIPAIVVGLTIVAFGTSAPELLVSLTAASQGKTEVAFANVNGSNIANIFLVLGVASLVRPLHVDRSLLRREIPVCLLLQLLVPFVAWDGLISRGDGMLLFSGCLLYNGCLFYEAYRGRALSLEQFPDEEGGGAWRHFFVLLLGLLVLVAGARLFVSGALDLALALNWSQRWIGLTVIALGTSLPEVATGVVSAYRNESDLAVGNSLGSNILNISMVLGLTAMIAPITFDIESAVWMDLKIAMLATLVLVPITMRGQLQRGSGTVLVGLYFAFLLFSAG